MIRRLVLFISFLINVFVTRAQVNLQTGAAQSSLSLYSYNDPFNKLSLSISLDYSAGNGLKVNEVAASTGTGWALNFGGAITRIQKGEPDDQKQDGTFPYPYPNETDINAWLNYRNNYYPNGYMFSEFDPDELVNNGGGYMPLFPSNYTGTYRQMPMYLADREQDVFEFKFNGREGYFVIGKNGEIKPIVHSKLRFEKVITNMLVNGIITRISEFQITDESGIKYVFKDLELSEVIEYENSQPGYGTTFEKHNIMTGAPTNRFVVGKWLLSEIINPLTEERIIFTYESYSVDMPGNKSGYYSATDNKRDVTVTLERIRGVSKRIKTILCSDKERVEFEYSITNRKDLSFDKALTEIKVIYDNSPKYSWNFQYGYFVKDQIKPFDQFLTQEEIYWSRMCLLSVQKAGANNETNQPPFMFNYYLGNYEFTDNGQIYTYNLKVSPLFSFYQDHMGYPNHGWLTTVNAALCERRPDLDQNSGIDWAVVMNYAANAFGARDPHQLDFLAGTLKSVTSPLGGVLSFEYSANTVTVPGSVQQKTMGGGRVTRTIAFDGIDHQKDLITEYKYIREDGLSSGWGYEIPVYQTSRSQRVYVCDGQQKPAAIVKQVASAIPNLTHSSKFIGWSGVDYGVGIRQQAVNDLIVMIVFYFLHEIFAPDYVDYTTNEWSTFSTNAGNTLPYQYARVEVINKNLGDNVGKTIHEFTSDQDYPIDVPSLPVHNSKRPRFAHWSYGLPKSTIVKDKLDNTIKKEEYFYDIIKEAPVDNNHISQKWVANKMTYGCVFQPSSNPAHEDIDHDIYNPIFGRSQLKQKKEYIYNASSQHTITTTDYEYSSNNFQVNKVKSTNSKGEPVETRIYFAEDYSLGGVIQDMKNQNMVAVPISSQTFITKGTEKYLLAGSVSDFGTTQNGSIKEIRSFATRSVDPVIASAVGFSDNDLIPNANIYTEIRNTIYNQNGLPVQVNSEQGRVSTIYDYGDKIPIATALNADYTDIAYTSFEADGNGGWTFDQQQVVIGSAPTGSKFLKASEDDETAISRNISDGRKYILSFWRKGDEPVLSGSTALLRRTFANQQTGYTYYEYEISNGAIIAISNKSGSPGLYIYSDFAIDELRLYPVEARMATVTVDPLVGKTDECDPNGRITYYEYDGLGRMIFVKDQFKNIIKRVCYSYSGMPENCDNYFYLNDEKSKVYTKNDCDITGGAPIGTVTYTVPQGRYSSLTSKRDANAKAEYDLNTNGQKFANDNGSCCYPSFSYVGGISSTLNQSALSGTTVYFTFGFTWPGHDPVYIDLGNIANCGRPASTRTIPYYHNNTLFHISISNNGNFSIQYVSGPMPTGAIVISSRYDLYANAFYSSEKSGIFTKECPSGQVGTNVPYSIKAYAYSSLLSLEDAEQQAQAALISMGQSYANTNGTCNTPCSFSGSAGITFQASSISSSGSVINFDFLFEKPTASYIGGIIGTISAGCRPTSNRSFNVIDGLSPSRTWNVTVSPAGVVEIHVLNGGPVTTYPPPIRIQGTFNL